MKKSCALAAFLALASCVNPYIACRNGRGADCGIWVIDEPARPVMGVSPDGSRIVQVWP